ncbi:MAG: sigma 54-interacting transcriptional regulator [Candidatus Hydrogenedentota bacterium]
MTPANILMVLGEVSYAEELEHHLSGMGHTIQRVPGDEQGVNGLVSNQFSVLIADLDSPRIDGLRLLNVARDRDATMPVIVLAQSLQSEQVFQAYDAGASTVLGLPYTVELVARAIEQGQDRQALEHTVVQLRRQLDTRHALSNLIGPSHHTATLHDQIRQAAPGIAPIIMIGETGTGRDHLAHIIHAHSARSHRAFVKVTFGTSATATIERELFGCGAGVYPDVPEGVAGRIESADQGSLYLDQLSDLTPMQADLLLTCLETRSVQRLGDSRNIPTDVRLIVSINTPLDDSDSTVRFLDQLQQRFGALTLELAPLRERVEDIPSLVRHFVDSISSRLGQGVTGIDADAVEALSRYPWPGNIRELANVVERMVDTAMPASTLRHRDIPRSIREHRDVQPESVTVPLGATMHAAERAMIEATLRACDYNKEACALQLGIGLRTLYRKLKEYKADSR